MKKFTALVLALVMTLSLFGCGGNNGNTGNDDAKDNQNSTQQDPAGQDTAQTGSTAEAGPVKITLEGGNYGYPNPFKHSSKGPGTFKMWLIYDNLMEKDEEGLVPWLATDYSVSEDGLTYTFAIREGVKWSDGEALTPADVVFTFNYYGTYAPVSNSLYVNGEYMVKDVVDNGDGSVSITVNDVLATNLVSLAYVPIIPEHIWADIDDPYNYSGEGDCVGSGPYLLNAIDEEKGEYQFVSNPNFWGIHHISGIDFVAVSDSVLAFDNGDIDYLNAPWDLYDAYKENPEYSAVENQPFLGYNLKYNMLTAESLADVTVRQAIAYAVDRQQILDMVFNGHGYVASAGYLPLGHSMRNENITNYSQDLDKARELLNGRTFSYTLKCGDSQEEIKVCELVKMYLAEVGIEVNVVSCDSATLKDATKSGDYDMVLSYGGGWGSDPDSLHKMYAGWDPDTQTALYSNAILGYYNEELYELAQEQLRTVDIEARKKLIYEMQEIIADEVPCLPILNCVDLLVTRPATYDGWRFKYDHNYSDSCKLSFVDVQ